ncbi:unnamed protein product [Thelazia callipaeda]|uniref:Type II toxin-antitoxin system RelE/ParE family toxin n=1 Tax=Thelazia callipaeda TaxID=103827 RepID=A0A0N5CRY4_THECL|nr:unnamed protein product [Thelazia callipaeda]
MPRDQYGRTNANAYISEQIRNEIQRFESVHPCIYAVYDLIDLIPDHLLQNQLRDQVVCIEVPFPNSSTWDALSKIAELLTRRIVEFLTSDLQNCVECIV